MNHQSAESITFEDYAKLNGCSVEYARETYWQYETAFVQDIVAMNVMYALPTPEVPEVPTSERLISYRDILLEELMELDLIRAKVSYFKEPEDVTPDELDLINANKDKLEPFIQMNEYERALDIMADFADFNCDLQVYAASENCKHGYPNNVCMHIVMSSNFSKLDSNGKPIHDERGKFMKGPNYWKPESKLREVMRKKLVENFPKASQYCEGLSK